MAETSITAIKSAFLRSQVRQLSTPLEPSTHWRDLAPEPEDGHLSDKVIQDLVAKGRQAPPLAPPFLYTVMHNVKRTRLVS